ncbi:Protein YceI [BD1-7 clade bacterium]|uniref:Protein YceI n=1 Tax=BD1-7 clade bacterium TaxID=2029982 RepID=A0A5S9NL57_9GAMM|nr:Protein YceI [BD1-7 clade bacterium]CAA0094291.1 Protein YceI [BD1-7 clade bacterium]
MNAFLKAAVLSAATLSAGLSATSAAAADYTIDTKGAHAFVQFKIKHLGYSWLLGRFNNFEGNFSYDAAKPETSEIEVIIDTTSIDSNHAERDKHLKGKDFLNVAKYPKASFKSTRYIPADGTSGTMEGIFTLHGVTKEIAFPVTKIGEGKDPWGGYRVGFEGKTVLKLSDYGIVYDLGPASADVEIELFVEGIRQ